MADITSPYLNKISENAKSRLTLSLLIFKAGEIIEARRTELGLDRQTLADEAGVSVEDVVKVELGYVPMQEGIDEDLSDWTIPLRLIVALENF